jgi:hypothetical protein
MKKLINIRGACGTGKTEAVRQWCNYKGYTLGTVKVTNGILPITVCSGNIVVLGDYSKPNKCTGTDALRVTGGSVRKADVCEMVREICKKIQPECILYEHMLSSQLYTYTKEIADVAAQYGYEYKGIQLWSDDATRMKKLEARSGSNAGTKNFYLHGERTNRATELLRQNGYAVTKLCVTNIKKEDMWRIVENAIQKA